MSWPFTTSHSPIGLDIGTTSIKAVQLRRCKPGQWAVGRSVVLSRTGATLDQPEAAMLADVLERQGFFGSQVVVAAPGAVLLVDVLDLPPRDSGAPVEMLAADEVARSHKLAEGSFCLALWDLPAGQRGSAGASAMSVTLRQDDAYAMLNPLESVGLRVVAIDTQASALARAYQPTNAAAGSIRAILDIGQSAATLMLLVDGHVIYQRRLVDGGLAHLIGLLGSELRLGPDEASLLLSELGVAGGSTHGPATSRMRGIILRHVESLNAEIEAGLQYARHRHPGMPFDELLLAGGGARINGIESLLGSRLSVSAKAFALDSIQPNNGGSAVLAQAFGLALHGVA